jgi:ABC-type multidrug transport system fused ATPase/permease subunit
MEENNILNFIGIIVIITFLVWIFVVSKTIYFYLFIIKKWRKTEAKILECETKWFRSKTDSDTEGWKEMIKYSYIVNSTEYENDSVTKNIGILTTFKHFSKKYNFTENQKIEISYDPENPKNSIIETKLNPLTIIIPLIFYAVSYLCFFCNNVV